ncbi:MAG: MATE family efflux transporter [Bacteroidaceae bacterium]|nr:MATE family efflux transporter [Bacteroidaceae bacterium]
MLHILRRYGSDYRNLITLALPIIIGQLGGIITGLADTLMVGWHSTEELAASSFVNNVINAFIITCTGFSFGLTPLIGGELAQRRHWAIGRWLRNSLVANLTTAALTIAILLGLYLNLGRMGQPDELLPLIRPYFAIIIVSVFFLMAANTFRQFVEGIADPKVSMWILIIGNTLNIIGNYILIYGKCGMPEMGLYGAGISTLVSRIIMLLLFVAVFAMKRHYRAYRIGFFASRADKISWRRLNALGWPIGLQQGLEAGTFCLTAIMVGWLGSMSLAAHQIVITISTFSYTTFLGIGAAVAIRTGYFKGANDWMQVRKVTTAGLHIGLATAAVVCIILWGVQGDISRIFTSDTEVTAIVISLFPILILYQFFDSTQIILANALRGLADVKIIMWVSLITNFLIAIPSGYLLGFPCGMGIRGVWMAYPIGFFFSVLLLGRRALRLMKKN